MVNNKNWNMRKTKTIILLILAIFIFSTWQYRLLCVLGILLMWRTSMNTKLYKCIIAVCVLAIWLVMPNYIQRGRDRTYYVNNEYNGTPFLISALNYFAPIYTQNHSEDLYERVPMPIYLWNVFFPEEEIVNLGIKMISVFPTLESGFFGHRLDKELVQAVKDDFWSWKIKDLYRPFRSIGNNPGSFTVAQVWNEITGENHEVVTISAPEHIVRDRSYPVVIVAHGYLGCGDLYRGVMSKLSDCFVIHIGSRDLNGIYSREDIMNCLKLYLSEIGGLRYNFCSYDYKKIHFIGIGNGATGSDIALQYFSDKFASISYISAPCHFDGVTNSKVLMIGGGNDLFSKNLPSASEMLKKNGVDVSLLWDETENHLMFIHKTDQVIDFLKKELDL